MKVMTNGYLSWISGTPPAEQDALGLKRKGML